MTCDYSKPLAPAIHIYCIEACQQKRIHQTWVNLTADVALAQKQIDDFLASSPVPNPKEWGIIETREFSAIEIRYWQPLDLLCFQARLLIEYGAVASHAFNYYGKDLVELMLSQCYQGEWDSLDAFTSEQFNQRYENVISHDLKQFFDLKKFFDYLFEHEYDFFEVDEDYYCIFKRR